MTDGRGEKWQVWKRAACSFSRWAATYVLLGLRYSDEFASTLFEEVLGMEESATYQAIVRRGREEGRAEGREEGRAEGERRLLLKLGETKLGPPDAAAGATIKGIGDVTELEELGVRLMSAGKNCWPGQASGAGTADAGLGDERASGTKSGEGEVWQLKDIHGHSSFPLRYRVNDECPLFEPLPSCQGSKAPLMFGLRPMRNGSVTVRRTIWSKYRLYS